MIADASTSQTALVGKSEWYIAAIFFLIAGFFAPMAVGYILMIAYQSGGREYLTGSGLNLGLPITCAVIYFSVLYVAKFVKKRYVIGSPKRIALKATAYFLAIPGTYLLYQTWSFAAGAGLDGAMPLLIGFRLLTITIFASVLYESVKRTLAV
jgi:hypothetical protein